ncbi:hypothetical protein GCK32_002618 [Trichostrongylus colubriformis]|uniref:Uncharacterized protein n=1 Tax=Trichostrongylus colubriformis TaxID=6319 RepID=A0AAN8FT08_TRICO
MTAKNPYNPQKNKLMYYSHDLPYSEGVYQSTTLCHSSSFAHQSSGLMKVLKRYVGEKIQHGEKSLWK